MALLYLVSLNLKGIAHSNWNVKFQYRLGTYFISTERKVLIPLCSEENCVK